MEKKIKSIVFSLHNITLLKQIVILLHCTPQLTRLIIQIYKYIQQPNNKNHHANLLRKNIQGRRSENIHERRMALHLSQ